MKKLVLMFIVIFLIISIGLSQYAYIHRAELLNEMHRADNAKVANNKAYTFKASNDANIIPVVFHVLHKQGDEDISDAQIYDALRILNEDYTASNEDTSEIIDEFKSLISNANIQFQIASKDPNGDCTKGIIRYDTSLTYYADDNSIINQWPRSKYLNIYVVNGIGEYNAPGYTTYRPDYVHINPDYDAVLISYNQLGSIEEGSYPWSHILTMAVGNYLGLEDLWGVGFQGDEANCNSDDGLDDTPNTIGVYSCELDFESCGSLDMVQNFMMFNSCGRMFTPDQTQLINNTINSNIAQRSNLITEANHIATGVNGYESLCFLDFSSNKTVICSDDSIQFFSLSNADADSWHWFIEGSENGDYFTENPRVLLVDEGIHDVSLTITKGNDTLTMFKENYVKKATISAPLTPFYESFEQDLEVAGWLISSETENADSLKWNRIQGIASNGNYSLFLNNFEIESDYIGNAISEVYDLSNMNSATISFKWSYCQKEGGLGGNLDALRLFASKDCGENWESVFFKNGVQLASIQASIEPWFPDSVYNSDQWNETSIPLNNNWLEANILFKFEFTSDAGNNIFIDEININGEYSSVPILYSPLNESIIGNDDVLADWSAVYDASMYHIQVANNDIFSQLAVDDSITFIENNSWNSDTELLLDNLSDQTTYYWRVRMIDNEVAHEWSNSWSFTTDFITSMLTSINGNMNSILVYPNPVKDEFNLVFNITSGDDYSIIIYDIIGNQVLNVRSSVNFSEGEHFIQIDGDFLGKGNYVVGLSSNNSISSFAKFSVY